MITDFVDVTCSSVEDFNTGLDTIVFSFPINGTTPDFKVVCEENNVVFKKNIVMPNVGGDSS